MQIFSLLVTIGLLMATSVVAKSTGYSRSRRSSKWNHNQNAPLNKKERRRARNEIRITEEEPRRLVQEADPLGRKVVFRHPICHSLPAGRIPTTTPSNNDKNNGWTLVDFCLEGATGTSPALAPDCHYTDDDSSSQILAFLFDFYGTEYDKVFINNNGNLSFEQLFSNFTSTGFPSTSFQMVAPFWADVATGDAGDNGSLGHVWRKKLSSRAFAVAWDHVGHFNEKGTYRNTFQVVISDGNEPLMGPTGTNVCFCYENMSWTTGDASGGVDGFGGTPATVGTNYGNGIDFSQIGRYDSPGAGPTGINSLDNQVFCFSTDSDSNVPPIVGNVPPGNQIDIECDESLVDYVLTFAAPENYQTVDLVVSGESHGLVVTIGDGTQSALATLNWIPPTVPSEVVLTFTATDSEGGTTVMVITVTSRPPCCAACDFSSLTVYPTSAVKGKVLVGTTNGGALMSSCGLTVVPYNTSSYVTVLDSESPARNTKNVNFDPDLGSPSRSCGGVGRGTGGMLGEPWENCEPLGNVLIIQEGGAITYPNDAGKGGCMNFTFAYPATNVTLGLLDIDSESVTINVYRIGGMKDKYFAPSTGNNGYWTSDSPKNTDPNLANIALARQVSGVSICFSGSGAVTHMDYCRDTATIY